MTRLTPLDRARWMATRARWMTAILASAVLTLALAVGLHGLRPAGGQTGPSAAPAPAGSSSPLDPRIASLAVRHPGQSIEAIVQFKGGVNPERARWDVSRLQARVVADLHIINALAVKMSAVRARRLAANPDVHAVSLNTVVKIAGGPGGPDGPGGHRHRANSINLSRLRTTYDQTLNAAGLLRDGVNGSGIGVGVVDTGIDGSLPDFQSSNGPGSRVVGSVVTNPNAHVATDSYGHGTDVAGIIAGNGDNLAPSDPLKGQFVGVAPAANLVSIKVSDEKGAATVLDVIYGLQFAVDHRADYNLRVVNLSLDSQTPQSYTTDPLDAAAESAWMHGIVVVAAAGNRGAASDAVQYAPANDPYVITVGAVDENGTAIPSDDFIARWSSRGTTQDGIQKPDLYAPGAHIVSVLAPGSAFAGMCQPCQIGGEYIKTSGTSMAAPMISGLIADLLQAHPTWTPDMVKGALTSRVAAANPSLQEVDAARVNALDWAPAANRGLRPNELVSAVNGGIDYSRSSWSRSSWSTAPGSLVAAFARSSWSCDCSASTAGSTDPSGSDDVGSSRSSWSMSSWSTHFDPSSATG